MIQVKDLYKVYGETQVLHGLTFDVLPGHLVGLLGPNGSGKSTTLDILGGLLGPTDGSVSICGFDVVSESLEARAKMSYLPDNPGLYPDYVVSDFIEYMATLRGLPRSECRRATKRVMEECEIMDVQNRLIGHLSKGYRQRVALAASIVHQPEVLILDEPTDGLDPTQIFLFRRLIQNLSQNRSVILSSHILSEIQAVCTDVLIIQKGRLAYAGSLEDIQSSSNQYTLVTDSSTEKVLSFVSTYPHLQVSVKAKGVFSIVFPDISTLERDVSHFLKDYLSASLTLREFNHDKKTLETIYLETLSLPHDTHTVSSESSSVVEDEGRIAESTESVASNLSHNTQAMSEQGVRHETNS